MANVKERDGEWISVYCHSDLKERVKQVAEADDRSMSYIAGKLIERGLPAMEDEARKGGGDRPARAA